MEATEILLLIACLAAVSVIRTSAEGPCLDTNWKFRGPTHSCFGYIRLAYNWTASRDHCRRFPGPNFDYQITGHLAKVDSDATNTFITETVFPNPFHVAFIGLAYLPEIKDYRWDGFPNELPFTRSSYTNVKNSAQPYTALYYYTWLHKDTLIGHHFVCEHEARSVSMSCPPVRIQSTRTTVVHCQFFYQSSYPDWSSVLLFQQTDGMARCAPDRVNNSINCQSSIPGYETQLTPIGDGNTVSLLGAVTRQHEGRWQCSGYRSNYASHRSSSCDLKVYYKPDDLVCARVILPGSIRYTCKTNKVYPAAKCQWQHNMVIYQAQYGQWNPINDPNHESFMSNGDEYFKTECSVVITTSNTKFVTGILRFKMVMYPDVNIFELPNSREAMTEFIEDLTIEPPSRPVFLSSDVIISGTTLVAVIDSTLKLTCAINTGTPLVSSTAMTCDNSISQSAAIVNETSNYKTLTVTQAMENRQCGCQGTHVLGNTPYSTITFKVVVPPESVTCTKDLQTNSLGITCSTGKVYPQALCSWSYSSGGQDFQQVSFNQIQITQQELYNNNGINYYRSGCADTLTSPSTVFEPGTFQVRVTMYPNVLGIDASVTPQAFVTSMVTVEIESPQNPVFSVPNRNIQENVLVLTEGDDVIDLRCDVTGGNPYVQSTTLTCEYPISASGPQISSDTTSQAMGQISATREMNGKRCTCVGYHITGVTQTTSLVFNVLYPPEVETFTVNGLPRVSKIVNQNIDIRCQARGNPLSLVTVSKFKPSNGDIKWQSTTGTVNTRVLAKCVHNGRFRCVASDSDTGSEQIDMAEVDIRVDCNPTSCDNTRGNPNYDVTLGKPLAITMCVAAHPLPDMNYWTIKKGTKSQGWVTLASQDGNVTSSTSFEDILESVTMGFPEVMWSHLGQYQLVYNQNYLPFQLTTPPVYCEGDGDPSLKVNLGEATVLTLCVVAYPIPSTIQLQTVSGSTWLNYSNPNVTIATGKEFNTLRNVSISFSNVTTSDLGKYRLFVGGPIKSVDESYLSFTIADPTYQGSSGNGGGGGGEGAIIGAVVGVVVAIAVVVVIVIFVIRRKRMQKGKPEETYANASASPRKTSDVVEIVNPIYPANSHAKQNGQGLGYSSSDYAQVNIKDKESKSPDGAKEFEVYSNAVSLEGSTSTDIEDKAVIDAANNTYTNVAFVPVSACDRPKNLKPSEELVYIQLDFSNHATKKASKPDVAPKPEVKDDQHDGAKSTGFPDPKEVTEEEKDVQEDGPTIYAEISTSATNKLKEEMENEANNLKEQQHEKEETYENIAKIKEGK